MGGGGGGGSKVGAKGQNVEKRPIRSMITNCYVVSKGLGAKRGKEGQDLGASQKTPRKI